MRDEDGTARAGALADAIGALGTAEAAAALHRWLEAECRFDNITMLAFFRGRGPEVFYAKAGEARVFEKLDSHYVSGVYVLDPFYGLHLQGAEAGLYRLADIAPDQFQRNEYYATYYQRTTLIDEMAFFSRPAEGVSVTICIGRDASSGRRFGRRDLARAQAVAPVVNALACKQWQGLAAEGDPEPEAVAEGLRARLQAERGIALSPRQGQIALMILQGHSSISIGLALEISPQTVKVIRKQLYRRCGISSLAELFALMTPYLSQHG
jgi:DNA-binding CsgD family transcriptional regulator